MISVQTATVTKPTYDDLAALLARNLTLGPIPVTPDPRLVEQQAAEAAALAAAAAAAASQPKINYSISQHYHHSAHVVVRSVEDVTAEEQLQMEEDQLQQQLQMENEQQIQQQLQWEQEQQQQKLQQQLQQQQLHQEQLHQEQLQQQQRSASVPPQPGNEPVEQILLQNGIDYTLLSSVQLALFKMSTPDRREYLLQLWRICPPTRGAENPTEAWGSSSVEKEAALAQMRYERNQQVETASSNAAAPAAMGGTDEAMSLDGTTVLVAQQYQPCQNADGVWMQASSQSYMEPYMMSGYEELARREYVASAKDDGFSNARASDPVYDNRLTMTATGRASWPKQHDMQASMENQYGALMAMRESHDMEL